MNFSTNLPLTTKRRKIFQGQTYTYIYTNLGLIKTTLTFITLCFRHTLFGIPHISVGALGHTTESITLPSLATFTYALVTICIFSALITQPMLWSKWRNIWRGRRWCCWFGCWLILNLFTCMSVSTESLSASTAVTTRLIYTISVRMTDMIATAFIHIDTMLSSLIVIGGESAFTLTLNGMLDSFFLLPIK